MKKVNRIFGNQKWPVGHPLFLALFGSLSVLLFRSPGLVPGLGIFLSLFTPLPLLYLHVHRGATAGVLATAFALATAYLWGGVDSAILFLLEYGMLSLVIGEGVRRKRSPAVVLTAGVIFPFLIGFGTLALFLWASGLNPITVAREQVDAVVQMSLEFYRRMGMTPEQVGEVREQVAGAARFFLRSLPALGVFWYFGVAFVNYGLLRFLWLRWEGEQVSFSQSLKTWHTPDFLVWGLIASGFALLVPVGAVRIAGLNGILISLLVYLLQGLGVMGSLFDRWNSPRFLRGICYFFLLGTPWGLLLLASLGVFDIWMDPRKLRH